MFVWHNSTWTWVIWFTGGLHSWNPKSCNIFSFFQALIESNQIMLPSDNIVTCFCVDQKIWKTFKFNLRIEYVDWIGTALFLSLFFLKNWYHLSGFSLWPAFSVSLNYHLILFVSLSLTYCLVWFWTCLIHFVARNRPCLVWWFLAFQGSQ